MRHATDEEKRALLAEIKEKMYEIQSMLPEDDTDVSYIVLSISRERMHIHAYDKEVDHGSIMSSWYDESDKEWREFCKPGSNGWDDDLSEY